MKPTILAGCVLFALLIAATAGPVSAESKAYGGNIYDVGKLKPIDSTLKIKVGQRIPDFALPSIEGGSVSPGDYRGKKNVVLSFIPAAWTPVCSDQWPGYNLAKPIFESNNAVILGISVDNRATLHAWTRTMGGLWFPVLSDFWPHGGVAEQLGVLRTDGTAERALVFINIQGRITHIHVSDINIRPPLELIAKELAKMNAQPKRACCEDPVDPERKKP